MRRHLTPEEAAEQRRRARERRAAQSGAADRVPRETTGGGVPPLAGPSAPPDAFARPGSPGPATFRWDEGYRTPPPRRATRDAPPQVSAAAAASADRASYDRASYGRPVRRGVPQPAPARPYTRPRTRPPRRRVGCLSVLFIIVAVILAGGVATAVWADSSLERIDALSDYPGRPGDTPGTVTLIVGTDSREGLTPEQQAALSTGSESDAGGDRTDTMMLIYAPADGGRPMLISIPRDLLVTIPDYGDYKINAAYSLGGPTLLVQTLEQTTGIHIDHYAEIGFGGFASMVDDLGGVDVCIDAPIDDPMAGITLGAGCQTLAGPQALGFVRTRHGFAQQDLDRVKNQRMFLSALMDKALSPGTLLNPFRLLPFISSAAHAMRVDSGDHVWDLALIMWSVRSGPTTATVPFDGFGSGDVGSYLVWGDNTTAFFDAIRQGATPDPALYESPPG